MLDNSKAETGAAQFAGAGFIHAVEALEKPGLVFGRDADAGIAYEELDALDGPSRAGRSRAPMMIEPRSGVYLTALSSRLLRIW